MGINAQIYIADEDKQTVIFAYPNLFSSSTTLQVIRLEIGALAAWTPANMVNIMPYAAEQYPQIFGQKTVDVLTVAPERTFGKRQRFCTMRPTAGTFGNSPRYSRHYYDLYRMSATSAKKTAFANLDLLQKVIEFKMKFYPRAWARYQEAVPKTLKLVPPKYRMSALLADYTSMKDMLYGDIPSFDTVMDSIKKLEDEIHTL